LKNIFKYINEQSVIFSGKSEMIKLETCRIIVKKRTTRVFKTVFVADNSIWAAHSNYVNFTAVSLIPRAHIIGPWKWSSKRKSLVFQFQMAIM